MTKRSKILIFLIIISLLLVVYLIFTSKVVTIKPADNQAKEEKSVGLSQVELIAQENNYKAEVKKIVSDYEQQLAKINSLTSGAAATTTTALAENISQLKIHLLDLKVPAKFKDLHLNLVLSLTKIAAYFTEKNEQAKTDGAALMEQVKKDNSWLAN